MAKKRRRKASLHSAGKVVEGDILARVRELADDPALATPACVGRCVLFCPFKAARQRNLRVHAARDDPQRLLSFARRGNRLSRAYAAAVLVSREDKLPYIAELRLPFGSLPYVIRGKALPLELAGLQHHDDPRARLLAARNAVKSRGLHVYSVGDRMVCTGKRPMPPREFVEQELDALDLAERTPGRFTCEHGGAEAGDALVLRWEPASVTVEVCAECADESNTLHAILEHMATPNPRTEFIVEAPLAPLKGAGAPPPPAAPETGVRDYLQGAIGDAALIERARAARVAALRAGTGAAFVAGDRWFGSDAAAFIDALEPSDVERAALAAALAGLDRPVVVERASPVRALAEVWRDRGREALRAAAGGDAATADALYHPDATPEDVGDALKRAAARGAKARVQAVLPSFRRLPAPAALADAIARAHRADGADAARRLAQQKASGGRDRGVALAFLRALGSSEGQDWRFSRVDQELADALDPDARALLECPPGEYSDVLARLARAAGATDPVERA